MDLYEHMGKDLFRAQGIQTPAGRVCRTPQQAADAARAFGGSAVVKVQVQVGGRGKGGGVELCRSPDAAAAAAERMLHDGFMGHVVDRVLAEELLPIAEEFYTSIVLDRSTGGYLAMMTAEGGVDIETLARERPETIRRVQIDPLEKRAKDAGLQYVKLDGEVGIIGNGAGLVMSTLDVVARAGAKAANFLDIGGGASADTMATSLEVILSDPAVRCVFVNIFGGITRCD